MVAAAATRDWWRGLTALLVLIMALGHLASILFKPSDNSSNSILLNRKLLWAVRLGVAAPLLQWAYVTLGPSNILNALICQAVLLASVGLPHTLAISGMLYSITVYYWLHIQASWAVTNAQQLSVEAVRFLVLPSFAFTASRGLQYLTPAQTAACLALYVSPYAKRCSRVARKAMLVMLRLRWKFVRRLSRAAWAQQKLVWCNSKLQASKQWIQSKLQASKASAAVGEAVRLCTVVQQRISSYTNKLGFQMPDMRACVSTACQIVLIMWLVTVLAGPGSRSPAAAAGGIAHWQLSNNSISNTSRPGTCTADNLSSMPGDSSIGFQPAGGSWAGPAVEGSAVEVLAGPWSALLQYLGTTMTWQLSAATQMFERMDLQVIKQTNADTLQTLSGMGLVVLGVVVFTSIQAMLLRSSWFGRPRQVWYEAAKQAVLTIGEHTLSNAVTKRSSGEEGDTEVEALLDTLVDVVQPLMPGCSLVLTLLDEGTSESGTATQHIMLAPSTYKSATHDSGSRSNSSAFLSAAGEDEEPGFLPPVQIPLSALPSVQAVCNGHRLLFTSEFRSQGGNSSMDFSDWRDLARSYGTDCFLAVPLCFAQHDMGTLLLMSSQAAALDKHVRKLVIELGLVVSQTLYTLLCMQQMRAGDYIINDILPEKVRNLVYV
eukprot:GHUV01014488.1.p1 GENE.GHUV01014488.1~~GHUV01014488.1.p1  ORF type:complete len:755 (+),score=246.91 GHUV01014488.1:294-2267(+)